MGVGDGPWDMMRQFDDDIPQRKFDNFQVNSLTQHYSAGTKHYIDSHKRFIVLAWNKNMLQVH